MCVCVCARTRACVCVCVCVRVCVRARASQSGKTDFWGPPGMKELSIGREIKKEKENIAGGKWDGKGESHPTQTRAQEILWLNPFSP